MLRSHIITRRSPPGTGAWLQRFTIAYEAPYVPIPRLLARGVDLVLCLGDLTRQDLEPLADVQLPKLGVYGNHDDGGEFDGLGIESVHLRRVELCGLSFGGFSGAGDGFERDGGVPVVRSADQHQVGVLPAPFQIGQPTWPIHPAPGR